MSKVKRYKVNIRRTKEHLHNMECACCWNCGWRTPQHNNPTGCLFSIMSLDDMKACDGHSGCPMYVMDTELNNHLSMILSKLHPEKEE